MAFPVSNDFKRKVCLPDSEHTLKITTKYERPSRNMLPDTIDYWESGWWTTISLLSINPIRTKNIINITPGETYKSLGNYSDTLTAYTTSYTFYDVNGVRTRDALGTNNPVTARPNEYFMNITVYRNDIVEGTWQDWINIFANSQIQLFISLNSQFDGTYEAYGKTITASQEIDNDYIEKLSLKDYCFESDVFSLGSAITSKITLGIDRDALNMEVTDISVIDIEYGLYINENTIEWIPIGVYDIENIDTSDSDIITFTLLDYMNRFNVPYDGSGVVPCTRFQLLQDICEKVGVQLGSNSILNGDVLVSVYDNTISAKTYLSFISERAGGFATIGRDGMLYIKSYNQVDEITVDDDTIGDFSRGTLFSISKIVFENSIQKYEAGDDTGATIRLSVESPFSCSQEEVDSLFNALNGLQFQTVDLKTLVDPSADKGDIIRFLNFVSFVQKDWDYNNGFYGRYKTTLKDNATTSSVNKVSSETNIRRFGARIDELNGEITQVAEQTSSNSSRITSITQNVTTIQHQVTETGGTNLLRNTRLYRNLEEWELSNPITFDVLENSETEKISLSKRVLKLNNGSIKQSFITEIGKEHTIAFKYKKVQSGLNASRVRIYMTPSEYIDILSITDNVGEYTEFSYTYVATVSNPTLEVYTNNSIFEITALIVQQGTSTIWSPNNLEIQGANYKFDKDGGHFFNINNESDKSGIDYNSLSFSNGTNYGSYGSNAPYYRAVDEISLGNLAIKKDLGNSNRFYIG